MDVWPLLEHRRRRHRVQPWGFEELLEADCWRMPIGDARLRLAELMESGELRQVEVEDWSKPTFLHPEARLPRRVNGCALLSPFDPLVWCRPRIARLFGFEYAEPGSVAAALAAELRLLAGWLGLEEIQIGGRGDLAGQLSVALG